MTSEQQINFLSERGKISIIGLGYVGLPLAIEFGKQFRTVGFDINSGRIDELKDGVDHTKEVESSDLLNTPKLLFSDNASDIEDSDFYIVTVPTPVDEYNKADLSLIKRATEMIAKFIRKNNIVIYESTVFPGVTEEFCVPIIEKISGLKHNVDFFTGYSPERINPGDKKNRLTTIRKITSGSTYETALKVDALYKKIITAGTYLASSIKVAEAAKVIENSQRDINIAFVNELAKIFNLMGIDTEEVLVAASTKWNFLPFRPGLVGGHCISVDPYYLAQKAQTLGYHPEIILSGRRINDGMGQYVANELVRIMIVHDRPVKNSKVLILGLTFKENCPDIRNTRVKDIYDSLLKYSIDVHIADPHADPLEVKKEYDIDLYSWEKINSAEKIIDEGFDSLLLAVSHDIFTDINPGYLMKNSCIVYDVKSFFPKDTVHARL
ncbi:MAG: nucleotide sugar dehydrogenase [Bacteroidota bacterium]